MALLYEQLQWGRMLASSMIERNDEFVFAYLEGTLQHRPAVLTCHLDYAATQYLLGRLALHFEALGDFFDIDKPPKKRKIPEAQCLALAFLQRFAKVAHRVIEMDGSYLQGVSQQNCPGCSLSLAPTC